MSGSSEIGRFGGVLLQGLVQHIAATNKWKTSGFRIVLPAVEGTINVTELSVSQARALAGSILSLTVADDV